MTMSNNLGIYKTALVCSRTFPSRTSSTTSTLRPTRSSVPTLCGRHWRRRTWIGPSRTTSSILPTTHIWLGTRDWLFNCLTFPNRNTVYFGSEDLNMQLLVQNEGQLCWKPSPVDIWIECSSIRTSVAARGPVHWVRLLGWGWRIPCHHTRPHHLHQDQTPRRCKVHQVTVAVMRYVVIVMPPSWKPTPKSQKPYNICKLMFMFLQG